jgi:two-component system, NtrC family, nitrogen regulation sensor histidine kinase NtrY
VPGWRGFMSETSVKTEGTGSPPFPRPPRSWSNYFAPGAVVLALLSALVTFLVLTGLTPIVPTHDVVVSVLLINLATAVILIGVITWELTGLVRARRRGRAGARLHVRIVLLFGVIATVPAILVAVIASITLDRGLDRWFTGRTKTIIDNSVNVARVYVQDHAFTIRADVLQIANFLGSNRAMFDKDREQFKKLLGAQAVLRGTPAVMLIRPDRSLIERADINIGREFVVPPNIDPRLATTEQPLLVLADTNDFAFAIAPVPNFVDAYVYVARLIDPRVIQYLQQSEESALEYQSLEERRVGVQVAFALMYALIALILLLSAIWLGINFANRLVAPIRRLITAADLVASGNLFVQVPVRRAEGDLASLGESFNSMTHELRTQRDDIVRARDQIDARRRFTEAVLAGVGAGVIGLNPDGRITIVNRSAERLTGRGEDDLIGKETVQAIPELKDLVLQAMNGAPRAQGTVTMTRGGRERTINVRVTTESSPETEHGYVITLDDITELVSAQRTSAWADVARRIAHEIKNPLTPIQLSAERLRRKYGKAVIEDKEIFEQCTETIIRQVGDIGRMVDEFSSFARMPKPVLEQQDLAETVRQAVFLQRVGNPDIDFATEIPDGAVTAKFDRRLVSQALTNVIKNATEAIQGVPEETRGKGKILVRVTREQELAHIDIIDNGIGLPKENREKLLEPYVTTREKGTGLGLAIVGKILEDHGGKLELHDAHAVDEGGRGARMRLSFPVNGNAATAAQKKPNVQNVAS